MLNSAEQSPRAAILVIDDDDSVLTLVHLCLKRAGYAVTSARGREPVLSLLASNRRFDLVVTDLLMPEIDGAEVITATKIHQPHAAILTMSAAAPEFLGRVLPEVTPSDAAPSMRKPFHLNELLVAVERALQRVKATPAKNLAG